MIVSDGQGPRTVLTGSTNFSVTGFYVNSNHVLRFDDRDLAATYLELFETVWQADVHLAAYLRTTFSTETLSVDRADLPHMEITFAPHSETFATDILQAIADRIAARGPGGPTGRKRALRNDANVGREQPCVGRAQRAPQEHDGLQLRDL